MRIEKVEAGIIRVRRNRVLWTLKNFLSLPQTVDRIIFSPDFSCLGKRWFLRLSPSGYRNHPTEGWVVIGLRNTTDYTQFRVRVGIVGDTRKEVRSTEAERDIGSSYSVSRFIERSEFDAKKNDFLTDGNLEIFCEIFPLESYVAKPNGVKAVKKEERAKAEDSKCVEASTQTQDDFDIARLQCDLKELSLSGKYNDVVLKVKGKEFKVHKAILGARSPVFAAMMDNEMTERASGEVIIEDSNPDTFPDFLHYLYTGSLEHLTAENVPDLFETSDKYLVEGLKRACMKYMLDNISVDTFCEVLALSLRHHQKELIDTSTRFFAEHTAQIIVTIQWQVFIRENPDTCNELLIKSFQGKNK